MGKYSFAAFMAMAVMGASLPIVGIAQTEPPSFRSLSACLAAKEAAFQEKEAAWAKLSAIHQPLSGDFSAANEDHLRKSNRYIAISGVCSAMERDARSMTDQVKELIRNPNDGATQETPGIAARLEKVHEIIDEVDPLRGTRSPVTKAIQEHNFGKIQDAHVALGARADKAISEVENADFSKPSPATRPLQPARSVNLSGIEAIANAAVTEALANTEAEMRVVRQQTYSGTDLASKARSARSEAGVVSNQSLIASTRNSLINSQPPLDAGTYRGPSALTATQCQQLIDQNREIARTVESLRHAPDSESALKDARAAHDSNLQVYNEKCR